MSRRTKREGPALEQSPTGFGYTWFVLIGVTLLFLFSFAISFSGLYLIAPWTGIPNWLYICVPLAIDLAILVYKVAEVKLKMDERPEQRKKAAKATFGVWTFTTFSSIGNVLHVATTGDPDPVKLITGSVIAGFMPWAALLAASVLTDILVAPVVRAQEAPPEPERVERSVQAGDGLPRVGEGEPYPTLDLGREEPVQVQRPSETMQSGLVMTGQVTRPDPVMQPFEVGRTLTLEDMTDGRD